MPDVGNTFGPIHPHEMSGEDVVKRGTAHLADVLDHPAAFLDGELHSFVAFKELDVLQCLIPYTGFVVDMKFPSLLFSVAPGRFPLGKPFTPMFAPLFFRLDLNQQGLRIILVMPVAEEVVDEEIRRVGVGLAVYTDKLNLHRLRNDVEDRQIKFLADKKVALKCGLERDGRFAAKDVNS